MRSRDSRPLRAQELAARLPPPLSNIIFVNSGSEANDLALLLARLHAREGGGCGGAGEVIALRNGYHGMGAGTQALTALSTWRYPVGQPGGVLHAACPDTYRGPWGPETPGGAGPRYADDVADLIKTCSSGGRVAGFIAETVQGVGGAVALPPGYLEAAYAHVRGAGGLCIADEVQTGFGRMGSHYWGFETQGVVPDVVTMAKGIGNGIPLAAVATTPAIGALLAQKTFFVSRAVVCGGRFPASSPAAPGCYPPTHPPAPNSPPLRTRMAATPSPVRWGALSSVSSTRKGFKRTLPQSGLTSRQASSRWLPSTRSLATFGGKGLCSASSSSPIGALRPRRLPKQPGSSRQPKMPVCSSAEEVFAATCFALSPRSASPVMTLTSCSGSSTTRSLACSPFNASGAQLCIPTWMVNLKPPSPT